MLSQSWCFALGFVCSVGLNAQNLLVNGDFAQGNAGFTTGYRYSNDLVPAGTIFVGDDPQKYNGFAPSFQNHTRGGGLMLLANGAFTAGTTVWQQTVTVSPNTLYTLSGWAADWGQDRCGNDICADAKGSAPVLQITINGGVTTDAFRVNWIDGQWGQFTATWSSNVSTQATIRIVNRNLGGRGNDLALDDLTFQAVVILDPVPLSGSNSVSLLKRASITDDPSVLAKGGRPVEGAVADGVSKLVIRLPANSVGERFQVTVLNEFGNSGSTGDNGGVGQVGIDLFIESIAVDSLDPDGAGPLPPMAFVLFRAPRDFNTLAVSYRYQPIRTVTLKIDVGLNTLMRLPIKILRPPILLIPGRNGDAGAFSSLDLVRATPEGINIFPVPGSTNKVLLKQSASDLLDAAQSQINKFRGDQSVAAVQAVFVSYSRGALVVRNLVALPDYRVDENYQVGLVNRHISVAGVLGGSEWIRAINNNFLCRQLLLLKGMVSSADFVDLVPGSPSLLISAQQSIPTVLIGAYQSALQSLEFETNFAGLGTTFGLACSSLLPSTGLGGLFGGQNDQFVSLRSALALGRGLSVERHVIADRVHVLLSLTVGPDIMGHAFNPATSTVFGTDLIVSQQILDAIHKPIQDFGIL